MILVEGGGADKGLVTGTMRRGHTKVVTAELIMGLPDEVAQVLSPEYFTRLCRLVVEHLLLVCLTTSS